VLEGGEFEGGEKVDRATDMSRDSEVDRQEKRNLYLRRLARKRIYLAE